MDLDFGLDLDVDGLGLDPDLPRARVMVHGHARRVHALELRQSVVCPALTLNQP